MKNFIEHHPDPRFRVLVRPSPTVRIETLKRGTVVILLDEPGSLERHDPDAVVRVLYGGRPCLVRLADLAVPVAPSSPPRQRRRKADR